MKEESTQPFHFSKMVRAADASLRKKHRRRTWLRKMYAQGLAEEKERGGIDGAEKRAAMAEQIRELEGEEVLKQMGDDGQHKFLDFEENGEVDVEVEKLLR